MLLTELSTALSSNAADAPPALQSALPEQQNPMPMPQPSQRRLWASLCLLTLALTGCGSVSQKTPSESRVFDRERFEAGAPYTTLFQAPPEAVCEAARQALMGQGYLINSYEPSKINARKFFQPEAGTSIELAIQLNCMPSAKSAATDTHNAPTSAATDTSPSTTLYAVAWQDQFVTKRGVVAASLGVNLVGSLSLPVGSTEDALVKTGVETVTDATFYQRFFGLVQATLGQAAAGH